MAWWSGFSRKRAFSPTFLNDFDGFHIWEDIQIFGKNIIGYGGSWNMPADQDIISYLDVHSSSETCVQIPMSPNEISCTNRLRHVLYIYI